MQNLFFLQCGSYKQQSTKTVQDQNKKSGGPKTSIFELLKRKHDRVYLKTDSEENMCVIMKCNTETSYTEYVSISVI